MHYAVWIEAPPALRLRRGLDRDHSVENSPELWERWIPMERAFYEGDGTKSRANLLVDGTVAYQGENFSVIGEKND